MKNILCIAILLCTAYVSSQNNYSIASIPQELTKYSNSVLLDEAVFMDISSSGKNIVKTHRVIAVLNKLGDNDPRLYATYDLNSKVKSIEAKVYNALGQELEHFKKRDFTDVSRTGISIYSDDRIMHLNYTPTTYPYIVVFTSEVVSGDTAFLRPWRPLKGYAESAQKSVMKIKFDSSNKPNYDPQNIDGFNISISETEDELTFTATNLSAIRYEEHSPARSKILPTVYLALDNFTLKGTAGRGKDWSEFGSWVANTLLADVNNLPEGTIKKVRSLVANETTNEDKARLIYQYVQDKVRYISIQIGIGGWKPMMAAEVDKLSYGDCKALTMYTKSLLDAVNVPSYYTLVNAGDNITEIKEEFTFPWFNHAILAIPNNDDYTWLECTNQDTPFGYIGDFTDDRDVLVMTPQGGKVVRTKEYKTEENLQENTVEVKVDPAGNVTAVCKRVSQGLQYDDKYLLPKKKQEDLDKYYKKQWSYINGFSIDNVKLTNNREDVIFTEELKLDIPNYANPVSNDYLFCANILNQHRYIPPRIDTRKQNLYISSGRIDKDTVTVEIPENFEIDGLPEATILETKFGKYENNFELTSENKLIYTRKMVLNKGEYPPTEYENFRNFLRSIARLDKTKILLKQNVQ
ncbi:MAG: DUF3857 domain-containing protein [Aequorivita sp.]|nr:DUF3857 domain-containing protein [Aequorivita sp.]|tara:strand:+ start:13920 stop:15821 length:1902 start_codon:yes stop_codon:yes gene_type:complete